MVCTYRMVVSGLNIFNYFSCASALKDRANGTSKDMVFIKIACWVLASLFVAPPTNLTSAGPNSNPSAHLANCFTPPVRNNEQKIQDGQGSVDTFIRLVDAVAMKPFESSCREKRLNLSSRLLFPDVAIEDANVAWQGTGHKIPYSSPIGLETVSSPSLCDVM